MQHRPAGAATPSDVPDDTPSARALTAPLIGRGAEMARLRAALADAREGRGCAVFLSGEPGIGKTRLARELMEAARRQGFVVLEGPAYMLEGSLAYAPVLAAFGPLLRRLDPARRSRLVGGLPDLGRLFADLQLPPPEALGEPALEKTRLFEAVARLLERLARQSPVLLFFDDLHWADPASIELLHYLARGVAQQAVLVLGTFRDSEIDKARGLRSLVTSLRRARISHEMGIARLGPEAVAGLVGSLLAGHPPDDLLRTLEARAAGTPLFVESLIESLLESGRLRQVQGAWTLDGEAATHLPPSIRDLILERLGRLAPPQRLLLDLVAMGGEAVWQGVLLAAAGLAEEAALSTLRSLAADGLVIEAQNGTSEETYTLAHPLIQEVAYATLPEATRRRMHTAFAAALERLHSDDVDRLARHYRAAGGEVDQERALEVLIEAGERAYGVYANDQAARHFGAALTIVRQGRHPELLPVLLEKLGGAWERLGETAAAVSVWLEARAEREGAGELAATGRLDRRLALAEWERGHFDAAEAHLEAGLRMLAGGDSASELADLLHARVVILGRLGRYGELRAAAQQLTSVAEKLGSSRGIAVAHLARMAALANFEFSAAREAAGRGLAAAEAAADPLLLQRCHNLLSLVAYALGEHQRARKHAEISLELARRMGTPTLELFPRNRVVSVDLMAGNWTDALHRGIQLLAMARRLESARGTAGALSFLALVHLHLGDLDRAAASIAEAHEAFGAGGARDRNIFDVVSTAEMMLAIEREDPAKALAFGGRLEEARTGGGVNLAALALIAEAHVMAGEPQRALDLARRLTRGVPPDNAYGPALRARIEGLALRSLGRQADSLAALERAGEGFTIAAIPFEAARARMEWAEVRADASAAPAAIESLGEFRRLGARRHVERAASLLRALGVRPPGPRRLANATGLSPRELEVVRLVAEDLTSAEIAERLVISPRTVTTHLDRIYNRLGIRSRTALVRYALEAGLLDIT
jgi:DNA-binding CsgD family transcriptional regulator/tetratricopeptide (TPR) repeat protein